DVRPGLPASIVVSRVPDRAVYGQGEVVEIASLVADRYGNQVPAAQVAVVSAPAGVSMGESRFRYFTDARYHLTATVQGETDGGVPLTASTDVLVDGSGPALGCGSLDGAILRQTPGSTVTLSGSVSDLDGVQSVSVNGQSVPVSGGSFTTSLTTTFGV